MENEEIKNQEVKIEEKPFPPIYKNKIFLSFMAVSFIVAFLIGGFVLAPRFNRQQSAPVSSPTPTSATSDETENWKTYSNSSEGFSFQYPPDLKSVQNPFGSTVSPLLEKDNPNDCPSLFSVVKFPTGNVEYKWLKEPVVFGYKTLENGNLTYVLRGHLYEGGCAVLSQESKNNSLKILDGIFSTFKFTDSSDTVKPTTTSAPQVNGASLENIKYTLPSGWSAKMQSGGLFISPSGGGYLLLKAYDYDGVSGRREAYCKIVGYCIDQTNFTAMSIGNISGYKADALDNSGGGPDYFGAKGKRFYIINSYNPPSPNEFEKGFQSVLNSLVF